ncbi:MAG: ATP-binding domain-containing protein [Candidatus Limnocylindrales bacterium]
MPNTGNGADETAGRKAERLVHDRLRAALPVPEVPADVILFDSIRRFKGLERPIIVLVELRPDDKRLDQLLYIGASRARQHLVVVAPAAVLERLR